MLRLPLKVEASFPAKLKFLNDKARYKVARGGRGSGKSWSFARALLIQGIASRMRILCAREVQLSIKQSVHKLLKDQIELLGIDSHYTVLETEIRGKNGTEFAFVGLSTLTTDSIKSFEGYDVCWVEEGQTISKKSWDILIPTIRKDGSEIWISYNPDLETDETHVRFTLRPPSGCRNVEVNWRDNPWFNEVLEKERLHCLQNDPDSYDNIWEGKCRPAVEGAIYYKEIEAAQGAGRIKDVPYDPLLRVHVVIDLGWEDSMAIGMIQKGTSDVRLIDYIEDSHKTLAEYNQMLRERKFTWGRVWLPHDGYAKRVEIGMGSDEIMRKLGWDVPQKDEIVQASVEEGIRLTRLTFPRIYFNKDKTGRLVECLKRYRRHIAKMTETPGTPLHDEYSHGADMLRYACVNLDRMSNAPDSDEPYEPPRDRDYGRPMSSMRRPRRF